MRSSALVVFASLFLFFFGCAASPELVPSDELPRDREEQDREFDARLRAADGVRDVQKRDEALAAVARLAADADRADVVRATLEKMRHVATQDRAASDCAATLAARGDFEGARQVADGIYDTEVRDEALLRIAESQ